MRTRRLWTVTQQWDRSHPRSIISKTKKAPAAATLCINTSSRKDIFKGFRTFVPFVWKSAVAASYTRWARKHAAALNKFLESKQLLNKTGIVGLKIEQITKSLLALKRAEQRVFFFSSKAQNARTPPPFPSLNLLTKWNWVYFHLAVLSSLPSWPLSSLRSLILSWMMQLVRVLLAPWNK